jgi:transcriptional regulator with XRE-family HTH domain
MRPEEIRDLREHLQLTQEVFARVLGVSFATVNRWENGKTKPSSDYARVLHTLGQLTTRHTPGPPIDWKRVGALSTMAAVAGFSPLLTLGAALAPVLLTQLPSWADIPFATGRRRARPLAKPLTGHVARVPSHAPAGVRTTRAEVKALHARAQKARRADLQRKGG